MRHFDVVLAFSLSLSASTGFAAKEKILLSRSLILESCKNGICKPIEGKSLQAEKTVELKSFNKAGVAGLHGEDKVELLVGKAPFRGEVFINKVGGKYSTAAVLRSGNGKDKSSVTLKGDFENIDGFKPLYLTDKPVSTGEKGFTGVRARLIVKNAAVEGHVCESLCKFRNKNGAYARETVRATGLGYGDAWTEMRAACDRLEKIANGGELQTPDLKAATEGNSCRTL